MNHGSYDIRCMKMYKLKEIKTKEISRINMHVYSFQHRLYRYVKCVQGKTALNFTVFIANEKMD